MGVTKPLQLDWTLGVILSLMVILCLSHQQCSAWECWAGSAPEEDLLLLQDVFLFFPLSQGYGVTSVRRGDTQSDFSVISRPCADIEYPISALPVITALPRSGFWHK